MVFTVQISYLFYYICPTYFILFGIIGNRSAVLYFHFQIAMASVQIYNYSFLYTDLVLSQAPHQQLYGVHFFLIVFSGLLRTFYMQHNIICKQDLLCFFLCNVSEKAMAPHSSTLAWKIAWMAEPGRLQSLGLLTVRHD